MVGWKQILVSWLCNHLIAIISSKSHECHSTRHSKCHKSRTMHTPCEREGYYQHLQIQSVFIICTQTGSMPCECPCSGVHPSRHNVKFIKNICDQKKVAHSGTHKYHFHNSNSNNEVVRREPVNNNGNNNYNCSDKFLPSSMLYLCEKQQQKSINDRHDRIMDDSMESKSLIDRRVDSNDVSKQLMNDEGHMTQKRNVVLNDPEPVIGWAIALIAVLLVVLTVVIVVALY